MASRWTLAKPEVKQRSPVMGWILKHAKPEARGNYCVTESRLTPKRPRRPTRKRVRLEGPPSRPRFPQPRPQSKTCLRPGTFIDRRSPASVKSVRRKMRTWSLFLLHFLMASYVWCQSGAADNHALPHAGDE